MNLRENTALVLLSGGQDSATCLAWALDRFEHVETVGFKYGQRHSIELQCRSILLDRLRLEFPAWAGRWGEDHVLSIDTLGEISDTALTRDVAIGFDKDQLPSTFVPGRNLIFFTFASAIAYRRGLKHLVGGMCEADYSGYPDCRDDTLKALQVTLNLGLASRLVIETPLMWIDKGQTWQMAEDLGGQRLVDLLIEDSHTCYLGERRQRHDWGYGCGSCPACELRRNGFESYLSRRAA